MAADSRAARASAGDQLTRTPVALTIAGSDSGGGAGIQADLKAFARCGVHGTSAITAITAQNTVGVSAVHTIPPDFVLEQVRAVVRDIGVDAVKVGMLGTAEIVHAVARALDELPPGTPVVVDPVMVAESGARLLDPDAQGALVAQILPRATVLTPNLPEARVLAGVAPVAAPPAGPGERWRSRGARTRGARARSRQRRAHGRASRPRRRSIRDRLDAGDPNAERELVVELDGERHPGGAAHGSGCTHSSVLAAQLALGRPARGRAGCPQARGRGRGARPARRRCGRRSGRRARAGGPPRRGIIGRR